MGIVVSYMQRKNRVEPLVVGILCAFMLYSVNLGVMERPNISVMNKPSLLSWLLPWGSGENWLFILLGLNGLLMLGLFLLMKSPLGLFLRAFGHHQKLLPILGKPSEGYRLIGLALSNLSGCTLRGFNLSSQWLF